MQQAVKDGFQILLHVLSTYQPMLCQARKEEIARKAAEDGSRLLPFFVFPWQKLVRTGFDRKEAAMQAKLKLEEEARPSGYRYAALVSYVLSS